MGIFIFRAKSVLFCCIALTKVQNICIMTLIGKLVQQQLGHVNKDVFVMVTLMSTTLIHNIKYCKKIVRNC